MKSIFRNNNSIIFFILFVFACCSKTKHLPDQLVSNPLSITIDLLNEETIEDPLYDQCGNKISYFENKNYEVEIALQNNTDSIINLALMTCSWDENIIINTDFVKYSGWECDSNYPDIREIKPHDRYILKTILKKNEYFRDREPYCEDSINLRMGLIIIEDIKAYDIIMGDKSNWRIVWSNSIKLKKE
ncbi:MAG: hypothetical protein QM660_07455 [Dysgonomonas sp.]